MNDLTRQWQNIDEKLRKTILRARRRGMNKAVGNIRNKTRSYVRGNFGHSKNKLYKDRLQDAVRVQKYREIKGLDDAIASVHILGTQKKGSGTFRLRFYENGTDKRYTGPYVKTHYKSGKKFRVKGHYTGQLDGRGFFKQISNSELQKAPSIINKEINDAINKLNG